MATSLCRFSLKIVDSTSRFEVHALKGVVDPSRFVQICQITSRIPNYRKYRITANTEFLQITCILAQNAWSYVLSSYCSPDSSPLDVPLQHWLQCITVPRTRMKVGDRAFSVAGPVVWNSLPAAVGEAHSLQSFKRKLKTHLLTLTVYLFSKTGPVPRREGI